MLLLTRTTVQFFLDNKAFFPSLTKKQFIEYFKHNIKISNKDSLFFNEEII